ncbi:hypothetical protein DSLPV1_157 [Dishui lake phycodnavirus 1]|uniref:hypothetical protein n=1 Tax=Dishui lake phycodnavirus 1 TaxID=2079134 RepID=UPI000CD6934B|nr:hypothetical protein C5Y57_gp157 [Dishui lake phycodnavirus 1]AUT19128.1 hypothetical protein DSLPV1_157 [Dishui lake phycodnavirus 1]
MDVQAIVDATYAMFEQYKDVPYAEVEIRLGRKNGTFFDTNVGVETFNRLMEGLRQYDGWESHHASTTDVYYNDEYGVRISVDGHTGQQIMVQKVSVLKEDFTHSGTPLDVRLAISTETPVIGQYEMNRKKMKQRVSFVRKGLSIDMTIVRGDAADPDAEEDVSYQVELEIVHPPSVECVEQFYNHVWKVNDLLKILQ